MKKIALHIDESNKVVLLEYKDVEERKKNRFLYGEECYKYIKKLSKNKIVDFYENPNGKDIILEYDKYIIELNDYSKLLRRRALIPILDNIRIYNEKMELPKARRKKVTRKNKYTKCKFLATGLAFLILTGCVVCKFHKIKKDNTIIIKDVITDNLEEDFITSSELFDKEVVTTVSNDAVKFSNNIVKVSNNEKMPVVSICYEDRSDTSKANLTRSNYSGLINKYSKMYGLDEKLVTAIATQERGVHSDVMDAGGATGLMQVQNSVWRGNRISAYNFLNENIDSMIVDEKSLSDVEYNIKVGCMIFQNNLKMMNYNTLAAIQCYNMGYGNMKKILTAYSIDCGKNIDQILNDVNDTEWMKYRNIIKVGDQHYIENVLSWAGDKLEFNNKNTDGREIVFNVESINEIKVMH